MLISIVGLIIFKQESIYIHIDALGDIRTLYRMYISENLLRIDKISEFQADSGVSPLMGRFIEGYRTEIYDLETSKATFINHEDSTYRVVDFEGIYDIEEELKTKEQEPFKYVKLIKDTCYLIVARGEDDSLNVQVCTLDEDAEVFHEERKLFSKFSKALGWDVPFHLPTYRYISYNILSSRKLLDEFRKIEGFPKSYRIEYFKDGRLMYSIHSKLLDVREVEQADFTVPKEYTRR